LQIPGPLFSPVWRDTLRQSLPPLSIYLTVTAHGVEVDPGGTVAAQDTLSWRLTLTNNTLYAFSGFDLEGILAPELTLLSWTGAAPVQEGPELLWSDLELTAGATLEIILVTDINDPLPQDTRVAQQFTAHLADGNYFSDGDPRTPEAEESSVTVHFQLPGRLLIWDNPARSRTAHLAYDAPGAGSVTLDIYNVLGERIRHFSRLPAGEGQVLTWYTDNDGGSAVANGTYILLLRVDDKVYRDKIVIIR
jgi:hypothetical protein